MPDTPPPKLVGSPTQLGTRLDQQITRGEDIEHALQASPGSSALDDWRAQVEGWDSDNYELLKAREETGQWAAQYRTWSSVGDDLRGVRALADGQPILLRRLTGQLRKMRGFHEAVAARLEQGDGPDWRALPDPGENRRVFIVHGHNPTLKLAVARVLEHLGLEAIMLNEQPNRGAATLLEKVVSHAEHVAAAIVLLTADDEGRPCGAAEALQPRARENVVFEFGLFVGLLSRDRVVVLRDETVTQPTDLAGVLWISVGDEETWKVPLARELQTMGFPVDVNRLR